MVLQLILATQRGLHSERKVGMMDQLAFLQYSE